MGPVAQSVAAKYYKEVVLLSNWGKTAAENYIFWLRKLTWVRTVLVPFDISAEFLPDFLSKPDNGVKQPVGCHDKDIWSIRSKNIVRIFMNTKKLNDHEISNRVDP